MAQRIATGGVGLGIDAPGDRRGRYALASCPGVRNASGTLARQVGVTPVAWPDPLRALKAGSEGAVDGEGHELAPPGSAILVALKGARPVAAEKGPPP